MTRIAYVDGHYTPQHLATVMMEDRGYQFADGVYEVAAFIEKKFLDLDLHLNRLERSLAAIAVPMPLSRAALICQMKELLRRNKKRSGLVYLQVTRGVAPRQHALPAPGTITPVLSMSVLPMHIATPAARAVGVKALTAPDMRWRRCDVKSIALLPNVLGRAVSQAQGLRETILYNEEGYVTEGSATNIFMVDKEGRLLTHPKTHAILPGITREVVIALAKTHGIQVVEEAFAKTAMADAAELFLTSSSNFVMPITAVDGAAIAQGTPGPITQTLITLYEDHVKKETT